MMIKANFVNNMQSLGNRTHNGLNKFYLSVDDKIDLIYCMMFGKNRKKEFFVKSQRSRPLMNARVIVTDKILF